MKKLKRIFSLMIAAVMVLAMNITVFAATHSITIADAGTGELSHTFAVYQIFTGTYGNGKLTNLQWGANGTTKTGAVSDEVVEAIMDVSNGTDQEQLAVIEQYVDFDSTAFATVTSGNSVSVDDGYYILKDTSEFAGKNEAYSLNVVRVVGSDIIVTPKSAKPTIDKQVKDETADKDTASNDNNGWGETADHAINEPFQFKLIATIPKDTDFSAYKEYKIVFTDTMSVGVTFDSIESVKVGNTVVDPYVEGSNENGYISTATTGLEGTGSNPWTITINNIIPYLAEGESLANGVTIEVIYNAYLNEDAVVNEPGNAETSNKNTVDLQYSNNPNVEGENLGRTEEDHVWVFTYEMPNTKVQPGTGDPEGTNVPLAGAGFRLYNAGGTTEIPVVAVTDEDGGVIPGEYRVAAAGETGIEMTSAETTGAFNISGLDTGTYILKETTTPEGFNTCEDVTIVISASHTENATGDSATTKMNMTMNGEQSTNNNILNTSGTVLPETGGIGTRIFYAVGAVLMIGAAVILITRKRSAK